MGDKGQISSGCPVCTLPGQSHRVVRHVRIGSNHCSTCNKDTNSRAQQLMPHHSNCHKPQMSTVWLLLSISIWKMPLIMCQYSSIMFDSTDWTCTEILAFFSLCFKQTFLIDSISRCGLGKHNGHLCHLRSVSLCFGGLAKIFVMLWAASFLCKWSAGAPAFLLGGFTSHGDAKGEGRSLT